MATDLWPMGRSASNARDTQKAQVQIGKNGCRIGWFLVNGCMFWYLKKRIVSHQESPPYANLVNSQGGCLKTGYSVPSHGESWFSPWSLPYFGCKCLHVWTIDVILLVIVYPIISHYLPLQYIQFTYIIYHVYIYVPYIYIHMYTYWSVSEPHVFGHIQIAHLDIKDSLHLPCLRLLDALMASPCPRGRARWTIPKGNHHNEKNGSSNIAGDVLEDLEGLQGLAEWTLHGSKGYATRNQVAGNPEDPGNRWNRWNHHSSSVLVQCGRTEAYTGSSMVDEPHVNLP